MRARTTTYARLPGRHSRTSHDPLLEGHVLLLEGHVLLLEGHVLQRLQGWVLLLSDDLGVASMLMAPPQGATTPHQDPRAG
jgi:hypothetical protein